MFWFLPERLNLFGWKNRTPLLKAVFQITNLLFSVAGPYAIYKTGLKLGQWGLWGYGAPISSLVVEHVSSEEYVQHACMHHVFSFSIFNFFNSIIQLLLHLFSVAGPYAITSSVQRLISFINWNLKSKFLVLFIRWLEDCMFWTRVRHALFIFYI